MKRRILFSISTLITLLGSLATPFSGALATTDPAIPDEAPIKDTWTVAELLKLKPELNAIKTNFCGDNYSCRSNIANAYRELGGDYGALAFLEDHRFLVTEVAPSLGRLKIYYNDEGYDDGKLGYYNLTELYVYWLDPDAPSPLERYSGYRYYEYAEAIRTRSADDKTHVLVAEDETNRETGWFTPGIENTYDFAPVTSFTYDTIFDYVNTENGSIVRDIVLSECVNSEDFNEVNTGCRQVVRKGEGSYFYLEFQPFDPTAPVETKEDKKDDEKKEDDKKPSDDGDQKDDEKSEEKEDSKGDDLVPGAETEPKEPEAPVEPVPVEPTEVKEEPTPAEPIVKEEPTLSEPIVKKEPASTEPTAEPVPANPVASGEPTAPIEISGNKEEIAEAPEASAIETTTQNQIAIAPSDVATPAAVALPLGSTSTATTTMARELHNEPSFPWWIFAIILPALGVLVWWFAPRKTKK